MTPFQRAAGGDPRALFGIPEHLPIVSFAGRLTPDNYIGDVAAVVERVLRDRRDVAFVIAGDGPEADALRRRLDGHSAHVFLLPFQPYDRVVDLRRGSLASLCLMGGFSLIEACAAGSPVIAYDVEWHRELVQQGATGFLVAEHDVDGVVAAVHWLLDHPLDASRMGADARRLAMARHDIQRTSQIKRDSYRELLEPAS
jgi:glycosyltransferase involved in cell wall biosynthesis